MKNLEIGTQIEIEKSGQGMKYDSQSPAVFIAGGIGITPLRSMIQKYAIDRSEEPIHLVYGNRSKTPFKDEFDTLSSFLESFKVDYFLTQPEEEWIGNKGRITKEHLQEVKNNNPKNSKYYIVGNPSMVDEAQKNLESIGVPKNLIITEIFTQDNQIYTFTTGKDETTICNCHRVTDKRIEKAILKDGAKTLYDIQMQTKASTGCGQCSCKVEEILRCVGKK